MRTVRLLAPVAAVLATGLLGCDGGDATMPAERYALTMNITSMAPHVGQLFELRIVHADTMIEVASTRVDPITSANFTVNLPGALIPGERYYVDFYADLNRNRRYDAPPADHAWRRTLNPDGGDALLTFMHDTNWTDIDFPPRS